MKRLKYILIISCLCILCLMLAGCSGKTINLNKYVTIESEGYDSIGNAKAVFDYDGFYNDYKSKIKITKKYQNKLSKMDLFGWDSDAEMMLNTCVDFSLNKNSELSNGDTITLKWICDEDTAKEGFGCKLKYKDIEFKIEDLEEVAILDPFEGLTLEFAGIAPEGIISKISNDSREEFQGVSYLVDNTNKLSNGDKITITANVPASMDRYTQQYGCILSPMEKEYTVDGLSAYAKSLNEIPDDALDKIQSQARDLVVSGVRGYAMTSNDKFSFSVEEANLVGYYFLFGKDGFDVKPQNKIYCIFKVKGAGTAYEYDSAKDGKWREKDPLITSYDEFYSCCELNDIVILNDGVCSFDLSTMKLTSETTAIGECYANSYGYKLKDYYGYSWYGFGDKDSMFNKCITEKIDKYNYENTVQ